MAQAARPKQPDYGKIVNVSDKPREVRLANAVGIPPQIVRLRPGESADVPYAYTVRPTGKSGAVLPSIVDKLTAPMPGEWGMLRPETDELAKAIMEGKEKPQHFDELGRVKPPIAQGKAAG